MYTTYKRALIIKRKEGLKPRIDPEVKFYALRSTEDNLWKFQSDVGVLPEALKIKFTKWQDILKRAEMWCVAKNAYISEIVDV
jgi:hypothetical protein